MAPPRGSTKTGSPQHLKLLKGSENPTQANQRRRGGKEPRRVPGVPNAPPYLSELERDAWDRFGETLGEAGMKIVSREEFAAFEALVLAYARHQRVTQVFRDLDDSDIICEKTLYNKDGRVTGTQLTAHPILAAIAQADATLANWLGRFGLTPGDAGRVAEAGSGDDDAKKNPMSEF